MTVDDVLRALIRNEIREALRDLRHEPAPNGDGYVSVPHAAERYDVTPQYLTKMIRAGHLPAIRIARQWRVRVADVERAIAAPATDEIAQRAAAIRGV
jgi:excisionase family DNA binding protein